MIPCVRIKPGVEFAVIAEGGFVLLSAIEQTAKATLTLAEPFDLWITSGTDGVHSGPTDPHKRGEAYDVRTHDFDQDTKLWVLKELESFLDPNHFFAFLESPGTENEHIHCQVKKGTVYPPQGETT